MSPDDLVDGVNVVHHACEKSMREPGMASVLVGLTLLCKSSAFSQLTTGGRSPGNSPMHFLCNGVDKAFVSFLDPSPITLLCNLSGSKGPMPLVEALQREQLSHRKACCASPLAPAPFDPLPPMLLHICHTRVAVVKG
jgi:hypothetical protein